jgi:hypothetical protein
MWIIRLECRGPGKSPLSPDICLRFGLWLPILGNSSQHLTMPHFLFSSSGSRPGRGDFNPQWDMIFFTSNVLFIYLSLLCFKARQSRTTDFANAQIRGIEIMLYFFKKMEIVLQVKYNYCSNFEISK